MKVVREASGRTRCRSEGIESLSWRKLVENCFHLEALLLYSRLALVSTVQPGHHWTVRALPPPDRHPRVLHGPAAAPRSTPSQGHRTVLRRLAGRSRGPALGPQNGLASPHSRPTLPDHLSGGPGLRGNAAGSQDLGSDTGGPAVSRSPQHHPGAGVLRRGRCRALRQGEAADLAMAELRPLAGWRGQRPS